MGRILLAFFFLIQLDASAQYPGYMGKKFTVGYSASLRPNFLSVIYTANSKYTGPAINNNINVNIVCSNNREIGLSAGLMSMRVHNNYYAYKEYTGLPEYYNFSLQEYGFTSKRFSRSRFAPLGVYSKWEFFYTTGALKYDGYGREQSAGGVVVQYPASKIEFKGGGFNYAFGRQRVLKDKIVFDLGIKAGFVHLIEEAPNDPFGQDFAINVKYGITEIPHVAFYAGIGFLAF